MKFVHFLLVVLMSIGMVACHRTQDIVPQLEVEFLSDFDELEDQITDDDGNLVDIASNYAKFGEIIFKNASGEIRSLSIELYTQDSPTKPKVMLSEKSIYGAGLGNTKSLDPIKRDYSVPFYVTATEYRSNIKKRYKTFTDFKSDPNLTVVVEVIEGRTLRTIIWKNDGSVPTVQYLPSPLLGQ